MIKFTVKIANRVICVDVNYDTTKKFCYEYLTDETPDFSVTIECKDIEFERTAFLQADPQNESLVDNFSDNYFERTALQRKIVEEFFNYNILLLHGSVVAVDGVAYLFTATSGTGKSTHTRLWRELLGERAVMVNDDKPFISVSEDGIIVHGSPWNGKHKLGNNISVPLRAICILERGEINEIKRIPASAAVPMLIQQSSRPKDAQKMAKYLELLDAIAGKVKFYRLACNMEREAAEISFAQMSKED